MLVLNGLLIFFISTWVRGGIGGPFPINKLKSCCGDVRGDSICYEININV